MSFISRISLSIASTAVILLCSGCVEENLAGGKGADSPDRPDAEKIINTPINAVEGQLLVCLSADESDKDAVLTGLSEGMQVKKFEKVFHSSEHNAKYLRKYGLDRWYLLEFDGTANETAAAMLAEMGAVSKVQFNTMTLCEEGDFTPITEEAQKDGDLPFDDKYLKDQWHYINTGDKVFADNAEAGADIVIKDVWSKITGGDKEIVVAILDGPVKDTHEDLRDNMWSNVFEIPGDKIDNDGNGYIDDIFGWNFEADTCHIGWDVKGESSHGTHVAGIVAAVNNNGVGGCGVAGGTGKGDGVRLMSCQIMIGGRSSNLNATAHAFIYAADNGAHIAQCSFGLATDIYKSDYQYFRDYGVEYWAIQYFLDKERFADNEERLNKDLAKKNLPARTWIIDGPLVIFASGNEGFSASSYPGALMDCISVSATGPDGLPAYYTNYGPGCNISAPGGDITLNQSTGKSNVLSTVISDASTGMGDYGYSGGTSMACPHVSGIAALGLSYAKKLGKTFTREEFTALLLSSVNDIDSRLDFGVKNMLAGNSVAPRQLNAYQYNMGTGTIDAWKFMMNIEGTPYLSVRMGQEKSYSLDRFFGEGSEYLTYAAVEIDRETMAALGITRKPTIQYGKLVINPCKVGSGKIKVTAIAGGKDVAGSVQGDMTGNGDIITIPSGGATGGTYITREISLVSRGSASDNGGWL